MKLLGAEVRPVTSGAATLKDAMNEALRDWVTNVGDTFYCIGTAAGPHPYPEMVRDFQSVIGREARAQILAREGVCIRAGHHCAQPLMRRLGVAATSRASFAVHNTRRDVDRLIDALGSVRRIFDLD
jgi:hypothetical protein